jgi:hypothetical protein
MPRQLSHLAARRITVNELPAPPALEGGRVAHDSGCFGIRGTASRYRANGGETNAWKRAVGVVMQLKEALYVVWEVKPKAGTGSGGLPLTTSYRWRACSRLASCCWYRCR